MQKPLLLLPAVIFLALGAAYNSAAAPQAGNAASPKTSRAGNEAQARAKKIYDVDCALCHNANGDGKSDLAKDMSLTLSDFTDPKTLSSRTDEQLFDLIRKGKDKMPGEEAARAKDDEVKSVIQYIRNMSKNQPAAAPAAAPANPPAPAASSSTPGTN